MPGIDLDATPGINPPAPKPRAPRSDKGTRRQPETPPRSAAEIMASIDEVVLMMFDDSEFEEGTVGRRCLERLAKLIDDLRIELRRAVEKGQKP